MDDYIEILKNEYSEQYNQYRWIGTMQSVILTFYGAIAAFSIFAVSKFYTSNNAQSYDCSNSVTFCSFVLLAIGILGILVGIGLIHSRSMQYRTQRYLSSILYELARISKKDNLLDKTSLRIRALCSSRSKFKFLDTSNIAAYLSFTSGISILLVGIFNYLRINPSILSVNCFKYIIFPLLFITILVISKLFLNWIMNRLTSQADKELEEIMKKKGLDIMLESFNLIQHKNDLN